jgi:molybdate transport system regulatory protein
MKISARNILKGKVANVTRGKVNAAVDLVLDSGQTLSAVITLVSADALGLSQGQPAFAIIKASEVMIGTDIDSAQISARNVLKGTVAGIVEGVVNNELTLDLEGGSQVVATITRNSFETLALRPGSAASAIIKASNVMIGV